MEQKPDNHHEDCDLHIIDENNNCDGCGYKHFVDSMVKESTFNCEDCQDTKETMMEGVKLGRPYYSIEHHSVITPYEGDNNFQLTKCHCVGD